MSSMEPAAPSALRRFAVLLIGAALLAIGAALTRTAGPSPVRAPFAFPAVLLFPLYLAALRKPLDFEYRKDAQSVTLVQLPLVLGALLVTPWLHLLMCLAAQLVDSLLLRRDPPSKFLYNAGAGAVEVALAATAVGVMAATGTPSPAIWLVLLIGILAGDAIGQLALQSILALLGRRPSGGEIRLTMIVNLISSTVFTSAAVVAISAAYTEPATLAVTTALALTMGLFYRAYRKQAAREQGAEQLYGFVRGLGPVSVDSQEASELLEEARLLLHCRHLDLAVCDERTGSWHHRLASDPDSAELADSRTTLREAPAAPEQDNSSRQITTSLLGSQGLVGVLTASGRLGTTRGFELGDVRLLETIALELATAFERGRLLADLRRSATLDGLTGLPNLGETERQVELLLTSDSSEVVVVAVSVDSFREVNDSLGHQVGDDLLVEVAQRLRNACPSGVVGRIGGGRFAVAVGALDTDGAALFGLSLRAQIEGTAQIGAVDMHVRLSVGCATSPDNGHRAGTLLRRAEVAMFSARQAAGGPVLWEPAYEISGQRRMAVVTALREAISNGAVGLAYQPKFDVASGQVTGVEALARWTHPALGPIRPDEFIPLAEASGLIGALTTSVLRDSLGACARWRAAGLEAGVAVNVSALTVLDPRFVSEVAATLRETGVNPTLLTLELTESVLLRDPALAVERLNELRTLGLRLSVDDFGTGYSSLTYLKGLPVDEVKVDKGFVDALAEDPADRAVVRAVVEIAHTLGVRVVAEGVEKQEQQDSLASLGVDEVQGYLLARPMPEEALRRWAAQLPARSRAAR